MRLWKWLGLAGLAGVAATGAVIARAQRTRTQMTPDEVRERLHARLADGVRPDPTTAATPEATRDATRDPTPGDS